MKAAISIFSRVWRVLGMGIGAFLLWNGSAFATPILTATATTAGFGLSQFAYNFPSTGYCCGPLGIAFPGGGKVMVSDYPGNVRIFPTDTDGQDASAIAPSASYGSGNAVGLASLGGSIYMTQQSAGQVVELNSDGTYNSLIVSGLPTATGIAADAANGKLYVSDCCSGSGVYEVDPVANTKNVLRGGSYDGLTVSPGGTILYAEYNSHIIGIRLSDNATVFDSGYIAGVDGTELGYGTLAGKIFANTNLGELWQIDLANPVNQTLLVSGGTRGDFVTADPNGSLLFTQTSDIWRLTAPAGGCIGSFCGTTGSVPEPDTLPLVALGLVLVVINWRNRRSRAAL